ncbi:MAG: hypothetical protein ABWZ15_17790 [Acidimicrobiia bacterium]
MSWWPPVGGVVSGALLAVSVLPYARDIMRGNARPERASWFIWIVLAVTAFVTQANTGATWSLFLPGAAVIETALVFALSLRYASKPFRAKDAIALVAVAGGVVAWLLTSDALWALLVTIAVDIAGAVLTMVKAHADPDSETLAAWVISALAAVSALSALGTFSWLLALYPAYLVAANAAVSTSIVLGRRRRLATT